jgi:4-amino-4-deoxy-L-arabinose transferase-like glycosyltransferase
MLMVPYQLVREDFGSEIAERAVLYLAIFPTAFFFAAAYNESLFLCLALLSFYYMRHGQC